jgi:RND family efflux transporter MFP subunit
MLLKKNLIGIVVVILVAAAFAGGFWIGRGGSNASSGMPGMRPDMSGGQPSTEQTAPTSPQIGLTQTVAAAPADSGMAGGRQNMTPEMQAALTKAREEGKSREEIQALMATLQEQSTASQVSAQPVAASQSAAPEQTATQPDEAPVDTQTILAKAREEGKSREEVQALIAAAREQSGTAQPQTATSSQTTQTQAQNTAVATVASVSPTLSDMHEFYGTAAAIAEVNVQSQQGGTIVTLNGKEGDEVKKGEVLARFDDSDQQLQIENAKSSKISAELQLQQAEANLKTAQTNLERNQELFKEGLISQQQMDTLVSNVETAQSSVNSAIEKVKQAETQIALQEKSLGDFVVRAPISGIIDLKNYNLREIYKGSDVLFHIIDIDRVYVNVDVPETYIKLVCEGMQVMVSFNALGDQAFTGVVDTILPSGSSSDRTFTVKVMVENPEQLIKPGMFANVGIALSEA